MQQTALQKPDAGVANEWLTRVNGLQIITSDQAAIAGEWLHAIAQLRKAAEDHHRPVIQKAHEAHKEALAALKRIDDPLARAESALRPKIAGYADRIRREEEAERRRVEEEARRAQEAEAEARIEEAEQQGATPEEVAAIVAAAEAAPAVIVAPSPKPQPIAPGVGTAERWTAQVTDIKALCRAIADGTVSTEFVVPNATALNQMARSQKQTFNVPGCRAVRELGITRRGV